MGSFALERSGALSDRERARFLKDVAKSLRDQDRTKLAGLRGEIRSVKKRRGAAMSTVVQQCRRRRRLVRQQVKLFRQQERERINAEVQRMIEAARLICQTRKEAVREAAGKVDTKKRHELRAERQLQRDIRSAEQWKRQKERKLRGTAREVQAESDDQVRTNIGADLVPVFERVKRSIKAGSKISRTEAFLQWVEENAGDVVAIQQEAAELELERLLKEQRAAERAAARRRPRTYKPSKAELARYLEGVPF